MRGKVGELSPPPPYFKSRGTIAPLAPLLPPPLLPVSYFAQRKSWMDAKVLQWFEFKFLSYVKLFCRNVSIEYKALYMYRIN